MNLSNGKHSSSKKSSKLTQLTLFDIQIPKTNENGTKIQTKQTWKDILEYVQPSVQDIPEPFTFKNYIMLIEIVEFSERLRILFCPDIIINRQKFLERIVINLKENRVSADFYDLYLIIQIFAKSLIQLEKLYAKSTIKYHLQYTEQWDRISKYMSYQTISEFIKILIQRMSYKPNDPMEKSYMRLLYIPEFYGFSWSDKFFILTKLYYDTLSHPSFCRKINELNLAVTKNDSDIKAPNLEKEQDKKIDNQTNKKKAHEESRLFCNRLPRFLKKRLLWELNFMPIILIEDSQNEMLYFYDKSHINSLKTFLENIKKKNIVTKFINHICNTPNSKHSHDKNLDVKENAKKHLCIIIERTFKKGDKLTTYENKLFQLNKLFPGKIIPWANFLTHFFSIFWQHLTKSKGSIKISSPLNTKQSLFAYITKIKSWSAICLASQIIIDNFVEDITYQKFMKSDAIKDTPTSDSETSTEDLISKCTKCSKVYESHTLSGSDFICRSCRLEQRNNLKRPVLGDSRKHNAPTLAKNSENDERYRSTRNKNPKNCDKFDFNQYKNDKKASLRENPIVTKRIKHARLVISSDTD